MVLRPIAPGPADGSRRSFGRRFRQCAMANLDVKRAACVGCGMCAHVCPRGVLKLGTKPERFKGGTPIRVYAVDL